MPQVFHKKPGILVAHQNVLKPSGGGVQLCHREYEAALELAGFEIHKIAFDYDRTLTRRIFNRLHPHVGSGSPPLNLIDRIEAAIRNTGAQSIFFAVALFSVISHDLKRSFPHVRQVFLSHGVEGLDFFIEQRIRRRTATENRNRFVAERMLGEHLLEQAEQRRWIDAVLTLSPFEVEVEKWLGSPRVLWVPRTIVGTRLEVQPVDQRVGCVSTLDHPPNWSGLVDIFEALEPIVSPKFRFRLIGQPTVIGTELSSRYKFVDYLGPLSDNELRLEVATWCCFVHPLFVYAKGCSTKLGIALGWSLPIATTEYGTRGHIWDEGKLPLARTQGELARHVLERCSVAEYERFRSETEAIRAITPGLSDVAGSIVHFFEP